MLEAMRGWLLPGYPSQGRGGVTLWLQPQEGRGSVASRGVESRLQPWTPTTHLLLSARLQRRLRAPARSTEMGRGEGRKVGELLGGLPPGRKDYLRAPCLAESGWGDPQERWVRWDPQEGASTYP